MRGKDKVRAMSVSLNMKYLVHPFVCEGLMHKECA